MEMECSCRQCKNGGREEREKIDREMQFVCGRLSQTGFCDFSDPAEPHSELIYTD